MDDCPQCGVSLLGDPIPEKYLHHNVPGDPYYNPDRSTCDEQKESWGRCFCISYGEGNTHFRREILIEISGVYDGGLFYQCPDCGGRWHRWPEGHYLRERAERYINEPEEA